MRVAGVLLAMAVAMGLAVPASAQLFDDPAPKQPPARKTTKHPRKPAAAAPNEPAARTAAAPTARTAPPAPWTPPPPKNGCHNTGSFDGWLAGFKTKAAAEGIQPRTIHAVLDGMTLDDGIIGRDRKQGFFQLTFTDFSTRLATPNRHKTGIAKIKQYAAEFRRAETEYGVPPAVIAAFWALESDFGSTPGMGKHNVLRSLGTLAYDCRRSEMFTRELMSALKIIDRGDLTADQMMGSWAGELGQTQFLPSHYFNYAVDFDGDGRRDLYNSVPDVIGSSANFVAQLGWKRGEPWLEEVRVPDDMPWQEADLSIKHPNAKWSEWGVTRADGRPLQRNAPPSSLLLLMGRHGPAFLTYPNFDVYTQWNQSLIYTTTAAYLATRIAGEPAMSKGNGPVPPQLRPEQMKELQILLQKRGFDVGNPDGKLGAGTRSAVRQMQVKLHQPADSWPTVELFDALRRAK